MNQNDKNFDELVDCWVYNAVANGVTNFNSLLKTLPGVYPSIALESLRRLTISGKLSKHTFPVISEEFDLNTFENKYRPHVDHQIHLPVPHPLDYDWRFGDSATRYLLNACLSLTEADETIALLGAPSVLQMAVELSLPRPVILLDNNSSIVNYLSQNILPLNIRLCNVVSDKLPEVQASVVVIDPPWYKEHLLGFMWAAANICHIGGNILASIPPVGTRPGIYREREKLFEWASKLGLSLKKVEPNILPYISPPFEINALKAEGFHGLLIDWRRGDLAVFTKEEQKRVPRPATSANMEDNWLEESLQGVRIKLKPYKNNGFKDPKLLTIVGDNIFPTVSRRDIRRSLVDVWTSGNRVFACEGLFVLQQILQALTWEQSPKTFVAQNLERKLTLREEKLIAHATEQILEIVTKEHTENMLFGKNYSDD